MTEQECLNKMVAPAGARPSKPYRGGVIQIHVTRACDLSCYACTQGSNLGGKTYFMSPEQFEQAVRSLKGYWGVIGVFGGNPCCAAGTKVFTTQGIYPIEDLENKVFEVRNLNGQISHAFCRLSGEDKPIYRVTLRGGHEYFATAEHEWPALKLAFGKNHKRKDLPDYNPRKQEVSLGKLRTVDLQPGMRLPILFADTMPFGQDGNIEDGFLAGWLLGDGWISHDGLKYHRDQVGMPQREVRRIGLIVNEADHLSGISSRLCRKLGTLGSTSNWRAIKKCYEITTGTNAANDWMLRFGIISKADGIPASIWSTASEQFRVGFIDGLFSADGNVEVSKNRGYVRVRLTSAHEKLAKDVSELLGFYGIKTQLEVRVRPGKFPNGKDYGKDYTSYTLSISNTASVERFARLFPLTHNEKNSRLQGAIGKHKINDVDSTNIEIISVELTDRREDVWDISVNDDTHCFQLAHCVTGNCLSPHFEEYCRILQRLVPREQRGLWCNHPRGKGKIMRETFNYKVSNLNVHLSQEAYNEFKRDWPECGPVGLHTDSRHSPVHLAMKDLDRLPTVREVLGQTGQFHESVPNTEENRRDLIATCDINQNWSAMIGLFRGELRAWFCEVAGAQAILHQDEEDYPKTGIPLFYPDGRPCWEKSDIYPGGSGPAMWWELPMGYFSRQVEKHCHECAVPLRGYGQLAQGGEGGVEQTSACHEGVYRSKRKRQVEVVTQLEQLNVGRLTRTTAYLQNSDK